MEDKPYVTAATVAGRPIPPKKISVSKNEFGQGISQNQAQSPVVESSGSAYFTLPKQESSSSSYKSARDAINDKLQLSTATLAARPSPPKKHYLRNNNNETGPGGSQNPTQSPVVESTVDVLPFTILRQESSCSGFTSVEVAGDCDAATEQAISELETGIVVTLLTIKKKSETLTLCLRRDLADLVFLLSQGSKPLLTVDLCQVKEIAWELKGRPSRNSDEVKERSELSATLLYGNTYLLQTVTFSARHAQDFKNIMLAVETCWKGVRIKDPYVTKQRWLRREFSKIHVMTNGIIPKQKDRKVSIKHILTWFSQMTEHVKWTYLTLISLKLKLPDKLDVGHFCSLVNEIMKPNLVTERLLKEFGQPLGDGNRFLPLTCFEAFLMKEQNEEDNTAAVVEKMLSCLPLTKRDSMESPGFSATEFEDYLFSSLNSVVKPTESAVHHNMDFPLSDYWIASSHNTSLRSHGQFNSSRRVTSVLVKGPIWINSSCGGRVSLGGSIIWLPVPPVKYLSGDQWRGESQVETYARCLQMGCRCVELDCWDGPDGKPVITHGKTFTSKIKVADVLQTIKDNAWVVTDYPLVLSIENHCSLPQQRQLATLFKETFQNNLLTEQIDPNETKLPSPNQLKNKIIIKNKKLQGDWKTVDGKQYMDISDFADSKKHGTLCMKYATEEKWSVFDVFLTDSLIGFTPHVVATEEDEIIENYSENIYTDFDNSECEDSDEAQPLTSQLWYHGAIDRGAAEMILTEQRFHGNGTFLVRDGHRGGLALSFYAYGGISHSIIKECDDGKGHKRYLIGNEVWHNSVAELVEYYHSHRLTYKDKAVSINLTYPVKRILGFEHEKWYQPDIDRMSAEEFLRSIPLDGVFLVRPSSVPNCFTLSLRYHNRVSHYQIEFRQNKFVIGTFHFVSMKKLIDYFYSHPLYKTAKLAYPASEDLKQNEPDEGFYTGTGLYYPPAQQNKMLTVTVVALYDYHAASADELSFKQGSYITNVVTSDLQWWRGNHAGNINKLFPANYVKIVEKNEESGVSTGPSEALLRLFECHIDNNIQPRESMHYFMLTHPTQPIIWIGSHMKAEAEDWLRTILQCKTKIGAESMEIQKQERSKNIAQELSDLVVYFQAVPFNPARPGKFFETSSVSEERLGKDDRLVIQYNQCQISRVYPKFFRVTSTNFDPVPKWNVGCQMVALNYQTPDKYMQINQAMFAQNGRCGYVLKPRFMNSTQYNPADVLSLKENVEAVVLTVTVLGGRNLGSMTSVVGDMQPFVSVEVLGLPLDCQRERTRISLDKNMLNPVWKNEVFVFHISCPDLTFIRFEVASEINDTSCLGQATFHFKSIRQGYRSIQLLNAYSEPLAMSSLLVHINIKNPKEEVEKNLFRIVEETRKLYMELSTSAQDDKRRDQLQQTEQKLLEYLNRSQNKGYKKI